MNLFKFSKVRWFPRIILDFSDNLFISIFCPWNVCKWLRLEMVYGQWPWSVLYNSHFNSFETKKKVNFQNFVQGFYKVQQCLNNNRKPYITLSLSLSLYIYIYIFGISIKFSTRKVKVEGSLLHDVTYHVIYLCFLMQNWRKKRVFYFITLKTNILCKLSLVFLILDVALHP